MELNKDITNRKETEYEFTQDKKKISHIVEEEISRLSSTVEKLSNEIKYRRKVEEDIRLTEKKYRYLFEHAPDMYHSLNTEMIITDCNQTEARMLGYKKSEIIGRHLSDFFAEESKKSLETDFSELKREKSLKNLARTYVKKDGTTIPVILNVFADYDENGKLVQSRAIARDISDFNKAEKDLALEEALHARHWNLIGDLAAGVAHEINNPINGIINYAQILLNKGKSDSQEFDIVKRIIRESDRIASIVRNLLAFASDRNEEKVSTNIREVLKSTIALTEAQIIKDGIRFHLDIPALVPIITAQPQQLQQVFLNIISNSRYALNQKYAGTDDNKILKIGINVQFVDNNHYLQINFYDRGVGIPQDIIDKILNPFFSTKPSNIGSGLGLSISHGIVSDHGGKLLINSVMGEYTRVIVEFPICINSRDQYLDKITIW